MTASKERVPDHWHCDTKNVKVNLYVFELHIVVFSEHDDDGLDCKVYYYLMLLGEADSNRIKRCRL